MSPPNTNLGHGILNGSASLDHAFNHSVGFGASGGGSDRVNHYFLFDFFGLP
jgi:hypothetical protein